MKAADREPTERRPWGSFYVLEEGTGFKVKRITVLPGKRLSYQSHARRSERWIVASGAALVTIDGVARDAMVGGLIEVPVGVKHRVENPGAEPLVFIEIQLGDYFGEDDIVRYEDDFGRA